MGRRDGGGGKGRGVRWIFDKLAKNLYLKRKNMSGGWDRGRGSVIFLTNWQRIQISKKVFRRGCRGGSGGLSGRFFFSFFVLDKLDNESKLFWGEGGLRGGCW